MDDLNKNSTPAPSREPQNSNTELEKLKAERDEYLNGWKRATADLINYKKEESKRLEDVIRFTKEDLLRDIISAVDHFGLGLAALEKNGPVDKGFYMIKGQLEDILRRHGVQKIKSGVGEAFDPMYHEAVAEIEGDSKIESGKIAQEIEPGYALNGRVIKPARVKIVK